MNDDLVFRLPPFGDFDDLTMKLGRLAFGKINKMNLIVLVKEKEKDTDTDTDKDKDENDIEDEKQQDLESPNNSNVDGHITSNNDKDNYSKDINSKNNNNSKNKNNSDQRLVIADVRDSDNSTSINQNDWVDPMYFAPFGSPRVRQDSQIRLYSPRHTQSQTQTQTQSQVGSKSFPFPPIQNQNGNQNGNQKHNSFRRTFTNNPNTQSMSSQPMQQQLFSQRQQSQQSQQSQQPQQSAPSAQSPQQFQKAHQFLRLSPNKNGASNSKNNNKSQILSPSQRLGPPPAPLLMGNSNRAPNGHVLIPSLQRLPSLPSLPSLQTFRPIQPLNLFNQNQSPHQNQFQIGSPLSYLGQQLQNPNSNQNQNQFQTASPVVYLQQQLQSGRQNQNQNQNNQKQNQNQIPQRNVGLRNPRLINPILHKQNMNINTLNCHNNLNSLNSLNNLTNIILPNTNNNLNNLNSLNRALNGMMNNNVQNFVNNSNTTTINGINTNNNNNNNYNNNNNMNHNSSYSNGNNNNHNHKNSNNQNRNLNGNSNSNDNGAVCWTFDDVSNGKHERVICDDKIKHILEKLNIGASACYTIGRWEYTARKISFNQVDQKNRQTQKHRRLSRVIFDSNINIEKEYIRNKFYQTMNESDWTLKKIELICDENLARYETIYKSILNETKKQFLKQARKIDNDIEMILFHGTDVNKLDKIVRNGFNRDFNVRQLYGKV